MEEHREVQVFPKAVGQEPGEQDGTSVSFWLHCSEWRFVLRGTNVLWTTESLAREKNLEKRRNIQFILKVYYPEISFISKKK